MNGVLPESYQTKVCCICLFMSLKFLLALQTEFKVSSFMLTSFAINNARFMQFHRICVVKIFLICYIIWNITKICQIFLKKISHLKLLRLKISIIQFSSLLFKNFLFEIFLPKNIGAYMIMLVKKFIENFHSSKAKETIKFTLWNFSVVHSKYQCNKVLIQKGLANFESIEGYKYMNI